MVRCQLRADPPFSSSVDDTVPSVVLKDLPAENACPKRALGMQVSRIEHDHLTHHVHDPHTTARALMAGHLADRQRRRATACVIVGHEKARHADDLI
jgi:hypothetical protein